MKKAIAGIIGGTGGMGSWFASLLSKEGCTVYVTGRNTTLTAAQAAAICNVIIIAVPIANTAGVIRQIGPLLTKEKLLMDLTSLKKEPVELMLASTRAEVIGCHPLFGPTLDTAAGQNIVLCPARGVRWLSWLKKILKINGLTVLKRTPEEHDKIMAVVQVLNHLNTISLGMTLAAANVDLAEIDKFSTPIFRTKMEIVKKIFTENPGLYADIIAGNPDVLQILDVYKKTISGIRSSLGAGKGARLKEMMEKTAEKLFREKTALGKSNYY
jgi:prephenate dehydrogenase